MSGCVNKHHVPHDTVPKKEGEEDYLTKNWKVGAVYLSQSSMLTYLLLPDEPNPGRGRRTGYHPHLGRK
eukprot:scaffold25432_cov130-Amphora_coffeaeformis.AAC.2